MSKGLVGFLIGVLALMGGAFVAAMLLKDKIVKKDEDDYDEEAIDDEEFVHFFGDEDEIPSIGDEDDEDVDDGEEAQESEEQL